MSFVPRCATEDCLAGRLLLLLDHLLSPKIECRDLRFVLPSHLDLEFSTVSPIPARSRVQTRLCRRHREAYQHTLDNIVVTPRDTLSPPTLAKNQNRGSSVVLNSLFGPRLLGHQSGASRETAPDLRGGMSLASLLATSLAALTLCECPSPCSCAARPPTWKFDGAS